MKSFSKRRVTREGASSTERKNLSEVGDIERQDPSFNLSRQDSARGAPQDQIFMREALKQARTALEKDEVPIGAVIVHEGKLIAKAHNQVETLKDPTAHAEMIAITQATNSLSSKWLHECALYVTLEPCAMCAGALVLSRIKKIYFGALDPKAGACGSVCNLVQHERLNHRVPIYGQLMAQECGQLLTAFFQKKRKLNKRF